MWKIAVVNYCISLSHFSMSLTERDWPRLSLTWKKSGGCRWPGTNLTAATDLEERASHHPAVFKMAGTERIQETPQLSWQFSMPKSMQITGLALREFKALRQLVWNGGSAHQRRHWGRVQWMIGLIPLREFKKLCNWAGVAFMYI